MDSFRAVVVERDGERRQSVSLKRLSGADLMDGDVTLAVTHSAVNYKDGLAVTGRLPVVRRWPMVPGIDAAGEVIASADPRHAPGDQVVLTGWGVGETHLGGWAERMRVSGDWLLRRPAGLSALESMAIGTAGLTACLALAAIEKAGLTPADGPAVVTGASGGVGTLALMLLKKAGWRVSAVTGRAREAHRLTALGADEIVERGELAVPLKPLAAARWVAGIDAVGAAPLANLLSMMQPGGVVAACGNAAGMDLPASVAPFILRGVTLAGINSVTVPNARRAVLWARLVHDVDRRRLAASVRTIGLDEAIDAGRAIVDGHLAGRTVIAMA